MNISKITLGTAQLGLNYGIANVDGKPDFKSAINLLNFAWENGINAFDTSPLYGNSEEIVGSFISSLQKEEIKNCIVITKLSEIVKKLDYDYDKLLNLIKREINNSLTRLNIESIPIYLIHNAPDILFKDGLVIKCLSQIKKEGLIKKFGISIYNPEEAEASLSFNEIDVIQVPINIFDQRLIKTGLLGKLKKANYIILARSVFLQGLYFFSPSSLPNKLKFAEDALTRLYVLIKEYHLDVAQLAFLFVRDLPEIASSVIGVEKIEQLEMNLRLIKMEPLAKEIFQAIIEEFSDTPEKIVNPSLWNI